MTKSVVEVILLASLKIQECSLLEKISVTFQILKETSKVILHNLTSL
jgi:hypothetical protein